MKTTREVSPLAGPLDTTVTLPGSKSITNRALICAALAKGTSTLRGALHSDDTAALVVALRALGISITTDDGETLSVTSTGGISAGPTYLDAAMSGTTSRFLLPLLALGTGTYQLDGHASLRKRPMGDVLDAIVELGGVVDSAEGGRLPVTVVASGLQGGFIDVPGDVSSQFLSGLLLSAPSMREGLDVTVTTPLVSVPYVEMTADVMETFGARIEADPDARRWYVHPGGYGPTDLQIEPDASAASYFFAAAAIAGGRVRVEHLDASSIQGDISFVEVLAQMGCEVTYGDGWTEVRSSGPLNGVTVDMRDISDTVQSLAVIAPYCTGPTEVMGVGFIRNKETDRIAATVAELQRCGIEARETADGLIIEPGSPHPAVVQTYDDHRMAMAFALLGLRSPGIEIADPGCVSKTFPTYWDVLDSLVTS